MSARQARTVLPGATLGVLGGGQLGRMFVHAAQALGYRTLVLDPDGDSPAAQASDDALICPYDDEAGLQQMAQRCAAVTTEFENVPAQALLTLGQRLPVAPAGQAVAIAQDRAREKAHFVAAGVPCAPHACIETPQQLAAVGAGLLPGILKTSRMGYDGRGQIRVANAQELAQAWDELQHVPCILERALPLRSELSVIVARSRQGEIVDLPVQVNVHHHGVLAQTTVGAGVVPAALAQQARQAAMRIAASLDYVGVLCVEFFVLDDGRLVANEMAPRPHNSGHYSIDACDVSQFELQVRTLAGLPLVPPRLHSPCVMLNLLGDLWSDEGQTGERSPPDWAAVLALPGVHLHLYGKTQARPGRKMGHLTVTAPTLAGAQAVAAQVGLILGLPQG